MQRQVDQHQQQHQQQQQQSYNLIEHSDFARPQPGVYYTDVGSAGISSYAVVHQGGGAIPGRQVASYAQQQQQAVPDHRSSSHHRQRSRSNERNVGVALQRLAQMSSEQSSRRHPTLLPPLVRPFSSQSRGRRERRRRDLRQTLDYRSGLLNKAAQAASTDVAVNAMRIYLAGRGVPDRYVRKSCLFGVDFAREPKMMRYVMGLQQVFATNREPRRELLQHLNESHRLRPEVLQSAVKASPFASCSMVLLTLPLGCPRPTSSQLADLYYALVEVMSPRLGRDDQRRSGGSSVQEVVLQLETAAAGVINVWVMVNTDARFVATEAAVAIIKAVACFIFHQAGDLDWDSLKVTQFATDRGTRLCLSLWPNLLEGLCQRARNPNFSVPVMYNRRGYDRLTDQFKCLKEASDEEFTRALEACRADLSRVTYDTLGWLNIVSLPPGLARSRSSSSSSSSGSSRSSSSSSEGGSPRRRSPSPVWSRSPSPAKPAAAKAKPAKPAKAKSPPRSPSPAKPVKQAKPAKSPPESPRAKPVKSPAKASSPPSPADKPPAPRPRPSRPPRSTVPAKPREEVALPPQGTDMCGIESPQYVLDSPKRQRSPSPVEAYSPSCYQVKRSARQEPPKSSPAPETVSPVVIVKSPRAQTPQLPSQTKPYELVYVEPKKCPPRPELPVVQQAVPQMAVAPQAAKPRAPKAPKVCAPPKQQQQQEEFVAPKEAAPIPPKPKRVRKPRPKPEPPLAEDGTPLPPPSKKVCKPKSQPEPAEDGAPQPPKPKRVRKPKNAPAAPPAWSGSTPAAPVADMLDLLLQAQEEEESSSAAAALVSQQVPFLEEDDDDFSYNAAGQCNFSDFMQEQRQQDEDEPEEIAPGSVRIWADLANM